MACVQTCSSLLALWKAMIHNSLANGFYCNPEIHGARNHLFIPGGAQSIPSLVNTSTPATLCPRPLQGFPTPLSAEASGESVQLGRAILAKLNTHRCSAAGSWLDQTAERSNETHFLIPTGAIQAETIPIAVQEAVAGDPLPHGVLYYYQYYHPHAVLRPSYRCQLSVLKEVEQGDPQKQAQVQCEGQLLLAHFTAI